VLPVVIATAENEALLGPDDLRPDVEAYRHEALGHLCRVQRTVPDIGDIAGEQRPSLAPVGPVVVQHLAGALGLGLARLVAPGRVIFHAIGWIGHHQEGPHIAQQPPDYIGRSAVTVDQPVRSELPKIARHRYRRDRRFGNVIFIVDRAAFRLIRIPQQGIQILVGDPQ